MLTPTLLPSLPPEGKGEHHALADALARKNALFPSLANAQESPMALERYMQAADAAGAQWPIDMGGGGPETTPPRRPSRPSP